MPPPAATATGFGPWPDELAAASADGDRGSGGQAAVALQLEVVHRLAKAALVGKLDPVVAASAAEMLIGSLLARVSAPLPAGVTGETSARRAAAVGPNQPVPGVARQHVPDLVGSPGHHGQRRPGAGRPQRPGPPPHLAPGRPRSAVRGRRGGPGDAVIRCGLGADVDQRLHPSSTAPARPQDSTRSMRS